MRNSCLVYDQQGKRVARYDKIHLFGFEMGKERYTEERTIEPGETRSCRRRFARTAGSASRSATTCASRSSTAPWASVDLILVPSAFTETTGKAHWDTLIRARAIENLAYVIAPRRAAIT